MLRSFRFDSRRHRRALLVLIASVAFGLSCAVASASGEAPAPSPTPGAGSNPFGLPRVASFTRRPTSVTVTLGCTGTGTHPCSGTILATIDETLQGKKVVAVSASKHASARREVPFRIAEVPFSLTGGQSTTIHLKLNSTGMALLRHFHAISAFVLAGETIPGGRFVFLVRQVRFIEPQKKLQHR